ncbi:MAG TPA: ATPase [Phycisphaerales bacterium]|nr:ATPase [Phycisphaerales bacterium]
MIGLQTHSTQPPPMPVHVSTPTDTTIVLMREFRAPRRLVWEAMFNPDNMRRWSFPPPGWTMTVCECDPRVGGMLRLVSKTAEADPAMKLEGVFTEVVPHERAVHTETMALGTGEVVGSLVETHEFAEQGGVTMMRITQVYPSNEARDEVIASGMPHEMEVCYERLDALLAGLAQ